MQKVTLLCLLLSLIFIGCSSAEFINPIYTALLSSANAVPNVGPAGAEGAAVCIYKRNIQPHTLDCEVQFTIDPVFGPFYAGIYLGDESTNGVEIFTFTVRLASGNFRQLFTIDTRTVGNMTYTAKQQEFDFLNGKWYIAISSEPYQLGALRGSLKHDAFMYARLGEDNIVPIRPEDEQTGASGIALATYSYYNPRRIAEFYIIHDVANPTGVKIQRGDRNEIGYTDYSFSEFRSPVHEKVSYLYSTEQALLSGEQYMVISSPEYPTGEIRGQLTPIDQAPPVSFTARLDGSSLLPPTVTTARGCALFAIDCETFRLEYLIFHSVNNPTLAFMNAGDYRSNGPRIWPLIRAESPIYGSRTLTSEEILDFYKGELYVTIGNDFYPNGEIRGQVTDKYNFYAYLSGINTIPPYTSSGVGCATFRMNENGANGRVIDYDIHFSVVDPLNVAVELVYGDVGASGIQIHQFNKTTSPVSGVDLYLDRAEENYFGTQRTYIQVGESSVFAGTAGQLRGQVYKTNSPCPFLTSRPVDLRSPVSSVFDNNYGIQKYFNFGSAGSLTPNHFVAVTIVSLLILLAFCFQ